MPQKNGAKVSINDLFQLTYVMRPPSSVRVASEFHVFVRNLTGNIIGTITVTEKSTVDDMKSAIDDQTGILNEQMRLIFSGKKLEDGQTVKNYRLQHGDTVHLVIRPLPRALYRNELDPGFDYVRGPSEFNVFVKDLKGNTCTNKVTDKSTVDDMKTAIQDHTEIPIEEIRLIFSGQQFEDGQLVINYGLQPGDTVYLVTRLVGGGPPLPRALNTNELDPHFDYDFTDVKDDGKRYMRGGFEYKRPYGWKRIAVKLVGKYQNDD